MRQFSADYLRYTREGMWDDSREALADLELGSRRRILDVGCGTGALTRVIDEESPATVVGVDVDLDLLSVARQSGLTVFAGDATRLPVPDDHFDLVVCQALLSNLPDPKVALQEFARVSSDLVAAIEPDNADVTVASTIDRERELERTVREAYLDGIDTDVALGDRLETLFRSVGLSAVSTRRYRHEKRVDPPYDEPELASAGRKASGEGIATHERELRQTLSKEEYDRLRAAWRQLGRDAIHQMQDREYRRVEIVPFDVTVGRV